MFANMNISVNADTHDAKQRTNARFYAHSADY